MRLLLLAPFPYGAGSGHGGAMVCSAMLKQLAQDHEVHVLCFTTGADEDAAAVAEMRQLAQVALVPLHINKAKVLSAKLQTWLRFVPEGAIYHESAAYRTALARTMAQVRPDVVITQFPQMAQYLQHVPHGCRVHDVQDAFSVSWFRRACSAPAMRKPYAFWQWLTWVAYERRYYRQADQCWTLSPDDSYGLKVFTPSLNVTSIGIPLLESANEVPMSGGASRGRDGQVIGFIASYGHPPNVEALECIVQRIAPALQAKAPAARIRIAGRNPPAALVDAAPSNVEFIGFVPSLPDFYAGCDLILAPLLSGGGVKIKVIEAMGYGKAVVTTSVGAEGIDIAAGSGACVVAQIDDMASTVIELLADDPARFEMGAAARRLVLDRYAAGGWRNRVNKLLSKLVYVKRAMEQRGLV